MAAYEEKDYVEVVDGDGNPVPGFDNPVPKAWVGTDLLPKGAKAKGRSSGRSSGKDDAKAAEAKAAADSKPADSSGDKTGPEGS